MPDVLTDPLGVVVDLVAGSETALDRARIADVVVGVAGGRAKRRRLAQALRQRPTVLTDGRSPAPRAVGNLLIALRNAGAIGISAPVCAECGRGLRTLQRRGQNWYCGCTARRPRSAPAAARSGRSRRATGGSDHTAGSARSPQSKIPLTS